MCLKITKDAVLMIAEEDITCYKFLLLNSGYLMTPFQGMIVKIGGKYASKIVRTKNLRTSDTVETAFHSFVKSYDCMYYSRSLSNVVTSKCIIPKGAEYYLGTFKGKLGYASSEIIYENIED